MPGTLTFAILTDGSVSSKEPTNKKLNVSKIMSFASLRLHANGPKGENNLVLVRLWDK